jgi:chromosome segregation ATPase
MEFYFCIILLCFEEFFCSFCECLDHLNKMSDSKQMIESDEKQYALIAAQSQELMKDLTMTYSMVQYVNKSYNMVKVLKENRPILNENDPNSAQALALWNELDKKIKVVHNAGQLLKKSEVFLSAKIKSLLHQFDVLYEEFEAGHPIKPSATRLKEILDELKELSFGVDPKLTEALAEVSDVVIVGGKNVKNDDLKTLVADLGVLRLKIAEKNNKLAQLIGQIAGLEFQLNSMGHRSNLESDMKQVEGQIDASSKRVNDLKTQRENFGKEVENHEAIQARAEAKKKEIRERYANWVNQENEQARQSKQGLETSRNNVQETLRNVPDDVHEEHHFLWFKVSSSHQSHGAQRETLRGQITNIENAIAALETSKDQRVNTLNQRRDAELNRVDEEVKQDVALMKDSKDRALRRLQELQEAEEKYVIQLNEEKKRIELLLKEDTDRRSEWTERLKNDQEAKSKADEEMKTLDAELTILQRQIAVETENLKSAVSSVLGYRSHGDRALGQVVEISYAAAELSSAERSRNTSMDQATANLNEFVGQIVSLLNELFILLADVSSLEVDEFYQLLTSGGDKISPLYANIFKEGGVSGEMFVRDTQPEEIEEILKMAEVPALFRRIHLSKLLNLRQTNPDAKRDQIKFILGKIDDLLEVFRAGKPNDEELKLIE